MLDRAYRLSSRWSYFSEECDPLRAVFSLLKYVEHLISSTVRSFVASKVEDPQPIPAPKREPNGPNSATLQRPGFGRLCPQATKRLSLKTHIVIQPVLVSNKIQRKIKVHEKKLPIGNQQRVAYKFQCDLCDASYVGHTLRHLHQRAAEHTKQSSSIGKHFIKGKLKAKK